MNVLHIKAAILCWLGCSACCGVSRTESFHQHLEVQRLSLVNEQQEVVGVLEGIAGGCRISLRTQGEDALVISVLDGACVVALGRSEGVNEAGGPWLAPIRISAGKGEPGVVMQQGNMAIHASPGKLTVYEDGEARTLAPKK